MTASTGWQRFCLISCAAFTASSLQAWSAQVEARDISGERLALTQAQKQALFKARRDWELSSYPQRLALLKNQQRCVKDASSLDAYRSCKHRQHQARRALLKQGRKQINRERERLGLLPMPERSVRHRRLGAVDSDPSKGHSWWNGPATN